MITWRGSVLRRKRAADLPDLGTEFTGTRNLGKRLCQIFEPPQAKGCLVLAHGFERAPAVADAADAVAKADQRDTHLGVKERGALAGRRHRGEKAVRELMNLLLVA